MFGGIKKSRTFAIANRGDEKRTKFDSPGR